MYGLDILRYCVFIATSERCLAVRSRMSESSWVRPTLPPVRWAGHGDRYSVCRTGMDQGRLLSTDNQGNLYLTWLLHARVRIAPG